MPIASAYLSEGMTIKQKLFCQHYLSNGFKRSQAARDAGYSGRPDSIRAIATENLQKPHIKKYLEARMKEAMEKVGVGLEWRLQKLHEITDACMEGKASSSGLVVPEGALKAISELNKMDGSYAPTQTENKLEVSEANLENVDDQINRFKKDE